MARHFVDFAFVVNLVPLVGHHDEVMIKNRGLAKIKAPKTPVVAKAKEVWYTVLSMERQAVVPLTLLPVSQPDFVVLY